jgi:prepilin-type N-terminal cleavage/methylation domain-containing protein
MRARQGFSITEVMVGVTIVGIMAVASVPNIGSFLRSQASANGAGQVSSHLRMARSRAVLEGNDYLVQFTGANTYVIVDDDGGANGIPGAVGYDAAHRNNWQADDGEAVMGPFTLPSDLRFETTADMQNPFTAQSLAEAISFPEINGEQTVVFHPNGTADSGGFVAIQSQADIDRDHASRCRVMQVVASTGSVESRIAGQGE